MPMRAGDSAWLVLTAGVVAYEVLSPSGELLSEAADRARAAHRVLIPAAVVYVAGHLLRVWPRRFDPLTRLAGWLR
ncbi:MAG: hypothetical protein E6Q97_11945 [Desulfurellales bacterium]|nr:MAG: hypothetical protein E6Q97_11945 [Desulfurellales bacterium]